MGSGNVNPTLADLLRGVMSERHQPAAIAPVSDGPGCRQGAESKLMDQEAQRCRESISKQPIAAPVKKNAGK
jgi:hypothetical protein